MKLIGATNAFTRAPFIVEGVVIGLIGSIIPLVMLYFIYKMALDYVLGRFSILQNVFAFLPAKQLFMTLIPVSLAIGIGIGFIGSWATTRKHLKV
jgi:cell division transport system permease protein